MLFKISSPVKLSDMCRVNGLVPMNCGSRMKMTEYNDANSINYDDNTCLILAITMHNVKKWKGLNREAFFHKIMDYIERLTLAPEIMSSIIYAIDEGVITNSKIDTILFYIWALIDKKNIGLHVNGKIHYYFFNEFQHDYMTKENTIYFDFDDDHIIPLIKYDKLEDKETMDWYNDIMKFQEHIENKLDHINTEIAKQLLEADEEEKKMEILNQKNSAHNEQTDMEIAKALQEEEDKEDKLRRSANLNNTYNIGQYETERKNREQYRHNLINRPILNKWEYEQNEQNEQNKQNEQDKYSDLKLCSKCNKIISCKQGLYWCDNCSKTIDEVDEEIENDDDDGPKFKSCNICDTTIIEKNGLFECHYCEDFDEDKHLFDSKQYDREKQLTSWDNENDENNENNENNEHDKVIFIPCESCGRLIKGMCEWYYCNDCNEYTLSNQQRQTCELNELDIKDNEEFWKYDSDEKYVDNGYFEREYPSDTRPDDPNNINTTFKEQNRFHDESNKEKDGIYFDPHYDDKYGKYNPNKMNESVIDKLNYEKTIEKSLNIVEVNDDDDDDDDLQRALKESKDMYLDSNVEENNIFAENMDNSDEKWDSEDEENQNINYYNNCYFNEYFKLQPDENINIVSDSSECGGYQTDDTNDTNDTNELINLL